MKIESSQGLIQHSNQEMFRIIQQAQQVNQDMSDKMIRLSVEQKVAHQKDVLVNSLLDIYI